MPNRVSHALIAIAIAALLTPVAVHAQSRSSGSRDHYYRCKDAAGQVHYGDSMPSACVGLDTEVLNERGMLVRTIEGEASKAARLQREALEAEARKERQARAQHDRMLIETYATVADIERLRDQRIEQLKSQYRVTEQNITNLQERRARIEQQIARYKPYSDKPNAPPLPDHLAEELVNYVNGERVYQESLERNKQEQAEVRAAFAADIKRFKELKGIK
jgi:hypothetical protein